MKLTDDDGKVLEELPKDSAILIFRSTGPSLMFTEPEDTSEDAPIQVSMAAGVMALLNTKEGCQVIHEALLSRLAEAKPDEAH